MFGLGVRKILVVSLVGGVFLLANVMFVAHWLNETGVVDWAGQLRRDFLTGTAITVIIALLILLVKSRAEGSVVGLIRRCPVCDHRILGRGSYCSDCGSKITA
jgi:hypothetical protein